MDELPDLLVEAVGDGTVLETVALGGGDVVAVTTEITHCYRSEGLLSDESVEAFDHDVERFAVDGGRRKSTLGLAFVDDERDLSVPSRVADDVVVAMLEGILRTTGVVDDPETILATFRFSELTLVVTDEQLLKHVGGAVWDDEYEAFRYADLTRLEFEEGSVATQVVLQADGRQQRVKVPNDHAGRVREDIQSAVFEFYDVSSLGGLHAAIEPDVDAEADHGDDGPLESDVDADAVAGADGDVGKTDPDADTSLDSTAEDAGASDPGADTGDAQAEAGGSAGGEADGGRDDGFVSAGWSPPADQDITGPSGAVGTGTGTGSASGAGTAATSAGESAERDGSGTGDAADAADLADRVDHLADRIDRQSDLLETQQDAIERLVDELRRGR